MTTIYLDGSALDLGAPHERGARGVRPDASSIHHLCDAGHRVVVVGDRVPLPDDRALEARIGASIDALPEEARGWLVSDRIATFDASRGRPSLRTVLIAPVADRDSVHRPADVVVRDLRTAILTILAAEAMGDLRT